MSHLVASALPISGAHAVKRYAGFGILGANLPTTGDSGGSPVLNDGIDPAGEYYWRVETPPSDGVLVIYDDLSVVFDAAGLADNSYPWSYRLFETGVDSGVGTVVQTVGTGGISTVISTAIASYTVRSAVQSDSVTSYSIREAIQQDTTSTYVIRGLVAQDVAPTYSIRGSVSNDASSAYNILSATSVSASASAGYNIRDSINQDTAASYALRGSVTQDTSATYSILSASTVSSSVTAGYAIKGSVQSGIMAGFSIAQAVQAEIAASYIIRAGAVSEAQAAYVIRGLVQQSIAASYAVEGSTFTGSISDADITRIVQAVLAALNATTIPVNIKQVNSITIKGAGVTGNTWGPL